MYHVIGGDLICCDLCPRVFHVKCVGLKELPQGDWICPECERAKHGEARDAEISKSIAQLDYTRSTEDHIDGFTIISFPAPNTRPNKIMKITNTDKNTVESNSNVEVQSKN